MTHTHGPGECFSLDLPVSGRAGMHQLSPREQIPEQTEENRAEKTITVSKLYKPTAHFSYSMSKKDIFCFGDSNAYGEYFSLDLDLWEEVTFSIDEHKRINLGRPKAGKKLRIFVPRSIQKTTGEEQSKAKEGISKIEDFKIVDNIIMFDRGRWAELRRVRGENLGLPLEVNPNGTIWIGDRDEPKKIKIFTRRGKE